MATRSRIGIKLKSGKIKSIYHHWDGYPSWLGKKLTEKYIEPSKIHGLMRRGDLSCIECGHDWNHKKVKNPIILSYKMRGEDCPAVEHDSVGDFVKFTYDGWCDYCYLFDNGEWKCYTQQGSAEIIP
jgi:hypothetical protein